MSSVFTLSLYGVVFGALAWLALRDRAQARRAIQVAFKSFFSMLPIMLTVIGLIGLLLGLVPPDWISRYLGGASSIWATLGALALGAVLYIASIVSVPLAGSLLRAGASVTTIAAFLTGLMMVGTLTLPLEIKYLGKPMALTRNALSLVFALIIAVVMGMILQ
ncbi:MAG: permease [Anaerolineales bacterium]|nr:permease [Anaerolineales bacterium]